MSTMIEVPSIKVSVPIPGSLLPRDILPPAGLPGSSKATVTLKFKSDGLEFKTEVKAKSYRDVLAKVDSSPHGAYVVLQGKLKGRSEIVEAGFCVQPIVPKEPGTGLTNSSSPIQAPAPSANSSSIKDASRGYLATPEENSTRMRSLHF